MIMSFLQEYKKMLTCLVFLIILLLVQYFTGRDLSTFINDLISGMTILLFGGAVKYSVLKTSERQMLNGESNEKSKSDYTDSIPPDYFTPGSSSKSDQ